MSNRGTLLASGIVVAGTAVLLAPIGLGWKLERDFRHHLAEYRQQLPLELLEYRRGWYSSRARSRLQLSLANGDSLPLLLDHRILHGPGSEGLHYAHIRTSVVPEGAAGARLLQFFDGAAPLVISSDIGFLGGVSGELLSPAASSDASDPATLQWLGLRGHFRYSADDSGRLTLQAPALAFTGTTGNAELRDIALAAQLQRSAASGLWLGESSFNIGLVEARFGESSLVAHGLSYSGASSEAAGLVTMKLSYGLQQLAVGASTIDDFHLRIALANLDARALKAYDDALRQAAIGGTQARPQTVLDSLRSQAPLLLARKPQLSVEEARMAYNGAPLSAQGRVRYVGDTQLDDFSAMSDLAGELRLELPRELLAASLRRQLEREMQLRAMQAGQPPDATALAAPAVDRLIEGLVARGLLVELAKGVYRVNLKLDAGQVLVNGQPLGGLSALPERSP